MHANILLIGLPGSGKTTIGYALAQEWQIPFYDTDYLLEKKYKKTCAEIYKEMGGERFRASEIEILKALPKNTLCVIAIGGGLPALEEAIPLIDQLGICFYLDEKMDTVLARRSKKPLPSFAKDWEHYKIAISQRLPYYEALADYTIQCSDKSPEEIISEIDSLLHRL